MVGPYCGKKPYVFLSYSHQDLQQAQSLIRNMQREGYRVWYDEGIEPGTEWDETIAAHVRDCGLFIALISKPYLSSSNCKDELNFARDLEKSRLIVYLEEAELSDGMKMRLSRLQAIYKYQYKSEESFYRKLFDAEGMKRCRDAEAAEQMSRTTSEGIPNMKRMETESVGNEGPWKVKVRTTSTSVLNAKNEPTLQIDERRDLSDWTQNLWDAKPKIETEKRDDDGSSYYDELLAILNRRYPETEQEAKSDSEYYDELMRILRDRK